MFFYLLNSCFVLVFFVCLCVCVCRRVVPFPICQQSVLWLADFGSLSLPSPATSPSAICRLGIHSSNVFHHYLSSAWCPFCVSLPHSNSFIFVRLPTMANMYLFISSLHASGLDIICALHLLLFRLPHTPYTPVLLVQLDLCCLHSHAPLLPAFCLPSASRLIR